MYPLLNSDFMPNISQIVTARFQISTEKERGGPVFESRLLAVAHIVACGSVLHGKSLSEENMNPQNKRGG